jgi:hypothetical protein
MSSLPNEAKPVPAVDDWSGVALRFLASVKLAVALLVLLVIVLAIATFVERSEGPGYVQWYVYHSTWFAGLLGLLAANIVAAAVVRYPWKPRHIGFLITHAGILVLMLGAMLTQVYKIEGRLDLTEGQTGDRIVLKDQSRFYVRWQAAQPGEARVPSAFSFKPGPVDWAAGKTLDLGEMSGVHLRVAEYLCRSRIERDWVADDSPEGLPALKFALRGAGDSTDEGHWLIAGPLGGGASMGPVELEFHRVKAAAMRDDFLEPPAAEEMDPNGVLSMHYEGKVERVPVGPNMGKKIPLGDGKLSVELAAYLPNAKPGPATPDAKVKFVSDGKEPKNPLLELVVHVDGQKEPLRQIAFANQPFQSFDGMHGRSCPVKFWYHHPAVAAAQGAQFVQTPDGKLYCRLGAGGKYQAKGLVREGDVFELSDKLQMVVVQHFPSARQDVSFHSVPYSSDDRRTPPPAVRLAVTVAGETQELWLRQDDSRYETRAIDTPEGQLVLSFGQDSSPLGFSLRLIGLNRTFDPGGTGEPVLSSTVRLIDKSQEIDEEREIGLNSPLEHGKSWWSSYRFFQSGPLETQDGQVVGSALGVTTDPGHWPKYLGSAMLCVGALFMFFRKAPFGRPIAKTAA